MGKTSTSTSQTQIPADVLARYSAVNQQAQQVAAQPFQPYSSNANDFVAPLTDTQQAGVSGTNSAANQAQPYFRQATDTLNSSYGSAQPYFGQATDYTTGAYSSAQPYNQAATYLTGSALGNAQPYNATASNLTMNGLAAAQPLQDSALSNIYAAQNVGANLGSQAFGGYQSSLSQAQPYNQAATGLAVAGAQAVNPQSLNIGAYMSPYLSSVVGSTANLLDQQNQKALNGALGNTIRNGAFGGDRAGIVGANLNQQLQLSNANVLSGLLNSGYSQALGAAQQQQGVNLSADQANRAALAGASSQIAGIGNQTYTQGTGTAQGVAGLGSQLYSQGAGTASALAGLGQQEFGQNEATGQQMASIGNQQFNQGLAGANQMLGIGNQAYNQGTQTGSQLAGLGQAIQGSGASQASNLANLGTGAQGAALSGAQAQLAAGQQQQQTQQAGLSALYNQYLMQQSYPFQVAQFLANIAEGTGSLSGQTTTTTQPGSLLSDERAKEGKRLVGFTFDNQPIYTFRYKGDHTTHMGLMAQEVEKRHPDAVGDAEGLKTVNYKAATDDAAKRGHYQRGGFAIGGSAGFDPQLMASMLQNAQGMYGPYMTGAGGAPAGGGGPYGASARVPAANLPVSGLRPAPNVGTPQQSGLHEAVQSANDVSSLVNTVEKGADWLKSRMPANDDSDSLADSKSWGPPELKRGGRMRYATGGAPYQGGLALDIPDDSPVYRLPDPPSAPKSGDSTVSDMKDIAEIAKVAAQFMNHGGRTRFADGGLANGFLSDEDRQMGILPKRAANLLITGLKQGGLARAHYAAGGAPDPDEPTYTDMAWAPPANQQLHLSDLARIFSPGNLGEDGLPPDSVRQPGLRTVSKTPLSEINADSSGTEDFDYSVPKSAKAASRKSTGLKPRASDPWANGPPESLGLAQTQPEANIAPSPQVAAPMPADPQSLDQSTADFSTQKPDHHAALDDIVNRVAPQGGYLDKLFHGDKKTLIPFLAALGAATGARTSSPLTAIAQGLSAGAKSYQDLSLQQPEIEQREAQVGRTNVGTQMDIQGHAPPGYQVVPGVGPNGQSFLVGGKPYHYVLQTAVTDYGGSASGNAIKTAARAPIGGVAPSQNTDAYMEQNYGVNPSLPGVANRTRAFASNPALAAQDEAEEKAVQQRIGNLGEQDSSRRNMLMQVQALGSLSHGVAGQGYDSALRSRLANMYQTLTGFIGMQPDPAVNADLSAHQLSDKIRELSGAQLAHQYGERAASVQHALSGVLPSGDLTPDALAHIASSMVISNQQSKDLNAYHNGYINRYGVANGLAQNFSNDYGQKYDVDQKSLQSLFLSPKFQNAMSALSSQRPEVRQAAQQWLDKTYGNGFHRYLTGGL